MNGDSTLVSGVIALAAALGMLHLWETYPGDLFLLRCHFSPFAAERTDFTHQSLRHNAHQRAGDHVRLYTHIHQSDNGGSRVIGMQGGKHQVSGDSGTYGNGSGFRISGLTNHDDIRVLSKQGSQSDFKGQSRHIIYLHLIQLRHIFLHRVFNGGNIYASLGQLIQNHIQGGRLTGTGWAGYVNNTIW